MARQQKTTYSVLFLNISNILFNTIFGKNRSLSNQSNVLVYDHTTANCMIELFTTFN